MTIFGFPVKILGSFLDSFRSRSCWCDEPCRWNTNLNHELPASIDWSYGQTKTPKKDCRNLNPCILFWIYFSILEPFYFYKNSSPLTTLGFKGQRGGNFAAVTFSRFTFLPSTPEWSPPQGETMGKQLLPLWWTKKHIFIKTGCRCF